MKTLLLSRLRVGALVLAAALAATGTGLVAHRVVSADEQQESRVDAADQEKLDRAGPILREDPLADVADIPAQDLRAAGDADKRYFLIGPRRDAKPPADGYGLLVVMPGGDGSDDFHPFVKRIYKYALTDGYLAAQPVAVTWTADQEIVWPTKTNPVAEMKFSTEEFLEAVIEDVAKRHTIDRGKVFTLSWSSSGPAAYATSLQERRKVAGSFIAMSVFNPRLLPPLKEAKGHAYYLYHSPEDRVCPYRFAEQARDSLAKHGAKVQLATYEGGQGWTGDVYTDIVDGVEWLEKNRTDADKSRPFGNADGRDAAAGVAASSKPQARETEADMNIVMCGLFGGALWAPIGAAPDGQNILQNPGFEAGNQSPAHWEEGAAVNGVQYLWDKATAQQGKASLCLHKTANRYFPIAQWFQTVNRTGDKPALRVAAQVKAERVTKAILDVAFLDENGKWISHEWASYIGQKNDGDPLANHDWKEYAGRVKIPKEAKKIQIGLQIYGPGKVWFDEVRAEYVD